MSRWSICPPTRAERKAAMKRQREREDAPRKLEIKRQRAWSAAGHKKGPLPPGWPAHELQPPTIEQVARALGYEMPTEAASTPKELQLPPSPWETH